MTTTSSSLPTRANTVSRILRKAGHDRAISESTSVRGYRRRYQGFKVSQDGEAVVRITFVRPSSIIERAQVDWQARTAERLAQYVETLTAEGYTATIVGAGLYAHVQVRR